MRGCKKIFGVGINDSDKPITRTEYIDGKWKAVWKCPYYYKWVGILQRCHYDAYKVNKPTYDDCKVCDEWLIFSNFKKWMEGQEWDGKDLDKDLLAVGSAKLYSPDTCVFLHPVVNRFIQSERRIGSKQDLPRGITEVECGFTARITNPLNNKREYLGFFLDSEQAYDTYMKRKLELAKLLAESEYVDCDKVKEALVNFYR